LFFLSIQQTATAWFVELGTAAPYDRRATPRYFTDMKRIFQPSNGGSDEKRRELDCRSERRDASIYHRQTNMKKIVALLLIITLSPLVAGLYGMFHDQLTYTIAPEYYTKFKFYQFGLVDPGNPVTFPYPRIQVLIVGFMATWWAGLFAGVFLGYVGLLHHDGRRMFDVTVSAMAIVATVTFIAGIIGLICAKLYLADTVVGWRLPSDLVDTKSFITVGIIHNFSYGGALVGLILGIVYSVTQRYRSVGVKKRQPIKKSRRVKKTD
jgi:hypothetical protein